MANFLGFKQVTLATYNGLTDEAKKHYLWLVRDVESGSTVHAAIYFGTRLYAQMNETDSSLNEKVENIITSLGDAIDENGEFVGFLPIAEHEILGVSSIHNLTEALEALEAAILQNESSIEDALGRIEVLEAGLTEVSSAITALDENVYKKDEIDDIVDDLEAKFSGALHFKGTVNTVADLENIENPSVGDVYEVLENNGEYAWNGEVWVELGSVVDLSNYYTKAQTDAKIDEAVSALTESINELDETINLEIEERREDVENINSRLQTTAETYEDATELSLELGQVVYVLNGEVGPSGHTAGAYIKTQDGIKKLEATNGDGSDVEDRVEALENKVGNTPLPSGITLTEAVLELMEDPTHIITGDDVE